MALSTPGVRLPWCAVTRFTAKHRPLPERVRMHGQARPLRFFPAFQAFTIRTCRRRPLWWAFFQLMACQSPRARRLAPGALATARLRTPGDASPSRALVLRDPVDVGSLSRRVMVSIAATRLRSMTDRRSLFPLSSPRSPMRFPSRVLSLSSADQGSTTGLPRSVPVPEWGRLCLFAGGASFAPGE